MNEEIKAILAKAVSALAACAFEAESVDSEKNPDWLLAVTAIDIATDDLRRLSQVWS